MLDLYGRCEQLAIVPCNKIPELKTGDRSREDVDNDVEEEKASADEGKGIDLFTSAMDICIIE